jgi:hypothetical protein
MSALTKFLMIATILFKKLHCFYSQQKQLKKSHAREPSKLKLLFQVGWNLFRKLAREH